MRFQAALEYLSTYGWALLIVGVVLAVFAALGLFNPSFYSPHSCIISAGFGCEITSLYPNGLMILNFSQFSSSPINVTAIGCTTNSSYSSVNMISTNSLYMPVGSSHIFNIKCYTASNVPLSGSIGTHVSGSIIVNYTNDLTGFTHPVYGAFSTSIT